MDLGPGCCHNRKYPLFRDHIGSLDLCQKKCLEFNDECKYVEHGWTQNGTVSSWCIAYNFDVFCQPLQTGVNDCGIRGGNSGVHSYKRKSGIFCAII